MIRRRVTPTRRARATDSIRVMMMPDQCLANFICKLVLYNKVYNMRNIVKYGEIPEILTG